jgi:hypothetical protein
LWITILVQKSEIKAKIEHGHGGAIVFGDVAATD